MNPYSDNSRFGWASRPTRPLGGQGLQARRSKSTRSAEPPRCCPCSKGEIRGLLSGRPEIFRPIAPGRTQTWPACAGRDCTVLTADPRAGRS